MKVLLHYPEPGVPAVGVWWLPKHRSIPKAIYLDNRYYTEGAVAVLGHPYAGEVFTTTQWENRCRELDETANPHQTFTTENVDDPQNALAKFGDR